MLSSRTGRPGRPVALRQLDVADPTAIWRRRQTDQVAVAHWTGRRRSAGHSRSTLTGPSIRSILATAASGRCRRRQRQAQGLEIGRRGRADCPARAARPCGRPCSITVPTVRPSSSAFRSFWMSSDIQPRRPAASRSTAIFRYCTPSFFSVKVFGAAHRLHRAFDVMGQAVQRCQVGRKS